MALRRYARTPVLGFGSFYGTSDTTQLIRDGITDGSIRYETRILKERERLDVVAGQEYGDGTLWWLIASASGIGWALQAPPGTYLRIPAISDIVKKIG